MCYFGQKRICILNFGGISVSLIKCTDCGKEISDMAKACPYCGCPVIQNSILHLHWANIKGNTFLKTKVFLDGNEAGIMKSSEYLDLDVFPGNHKIELYFRDKCAVCETIEVKQNSDEYFAYKQTLTGLKRVRANSVKWDNQKNKSFGTVNIPKCPTCGSTRIKKLSMTRRVVSVGMLGMASRSAMKTFACKNCGYKW